MKGLCRKVNLCLYICILLWGCFQACKSPSIVLQQDLSIGVEEGDENQIFGGIGSICLDSEDNIYLLDYRMWRVQKFDNNGIFLRSFAIQEGQGPSELTFPGELAVSSEGKLFLYDFMDWKILILDSDGNRIHSFKLDFYVISIKNSGDETLTVTGDKDNRLFHVFDEEGRLVRSFGEHFAVPQSLTSYDYPTVKYPQEFTVSETGRVYVCSPHAYEISVYRNEELEKILRGDNSAFWPVSVKDGRDVTLTGVSVFESRNRVYSFIQSHGEVPTQIDVFEKDRQIQSLDVEGYVRTLDSRGRLYVAQMEPFPRVKRYVVE